jgi:hypothetical protein
MKMLSHGCRLKVAERQRPVSGSRIVRYNRLTVYQITKLFFGLIVVRKKSLQLLTLSILPLASPQSGAQHKPTSVITPDQLIST